jgi:hypothetical protein
MSTPQQTLVALVWRHCPSVYSGASLTLLLKLAGLTKTIKGECRAWPSMEYLAKSCGVDRSTAQRAIHKIAKDKNKVLKMKERRGHSFYFYLQPDAIKLLPLVHPDDPGDLAIAVAKGLHKALAAGDDDAFENWEIDWPISTQAIIARGHSVEVIQNVARYAIDHEPFRTALAATGAVALSECFEAAKTTMGVTQ